MRRIVFLVAAISLLALGCAKFLRPNNKESLVPIRVGVEGIYEGWMTPGYEYLRLELHTDGTGVYSISVGGSQAEFMDTVTWSVEENRIHISDSRGFIGWTAAVSRRKTEESGEKYGVLSMRAYGLNWSEKYILVRSTLLDLYQDSVLKRPECNETQEKRVEP